MNVENRKLFANRDARRKLSEMGGIMASSPELLGEAQIYANGGDVSVEQYVAVIPGINNGRPIRLKADTLMRLQELNPALMQQAQVFDQATAEAGGVDVMRLRPGDAFVERQIIGNSPDLGVQTEPMIAPGMDASPGFTSSPDGAMPSAANRPIIDPMSDDSFTMSGTDQIMDRAQRFNAQMQSNTPITADPEMTGLELVEQQNIESDPRAATRARVANMAQAGARAGEIADAIGRPVAEVLDIGAGLLSAGLLETTAFASDIMSAFQTGVMGNKQAGEFYGNLASDIKSYSDDAYYNEGDLLPRVTAGLPKGPSQDEIDTQRRAGIESTSLRNISDAMLANDPSLFAEGSVSETLPDIPMSIIEARRTAGPEGLMMDGPSQSTAPTSSGSNVTMPGSMSTPTMPEMPTMPGVDVSTGVPRTQSEIAQMLFAEREAAADAGLTSRPPMEDRFPAEDLYQAEQQGALDLIRANEMARNERLQMTGFEETAARNAEAAKAERDAEQAAEETPDQPTPPPAGADQQTPPPAAGGAEELTQVVEQISMSDAPPSEKSNGTANVLLGGYGLAEPGEKLSPKETVSRYEKLFKEMLGESDEDSSKEMWHNMAMIGFAIAAGESPRALQNIANGLLAGTKMMKEDRASDRKRQDAITTMAIEAGLEDQRSAQKYARELALAQVRGAGSGYGNATHPTTATLRVADTLYADGAGDYDTYEDALNAARTIVQQEYGLTTPRTSTTEPETDDLGAHKTANDTAKAAGQATYIGPDGNTYKVQ